MPIKSRQADNRPSFHALAKLMVSGVFCYKQGKAPSTSDSLMTWVADSRQFCRAYGIDTSNLAKVARLVMKNASQDDLDESMYYLGEELKDNFSDIKLDNSLGRDDLQLCQALYRWYTTESDVALANLTRLVSILQDSQINRMFSVRNTSKSGTVTELKALVKRLTGRDGISISVEERKKVSDDDWKTYLQLRKEFKLGKEQVLQALFRSKGKHLLPSDTVRKAFKDAGVDPQPIADGFDGLIDEQGRYYTKWGDVLKLKGVAPGSTIEMNENYRPNKTEPNKEKGVLQVIPKGKSIIDANWVYTEKCLQARARIKESKVSKIGKNVNRIVAKFQRDLSARDDVVRAIATILEIMWVTSWRVGTVGNATDGEETLGVSTLKRNNLTFRGADVTIKFKGKSGVPHNKTLKPASDRYLTMAVSNLKELAAAAPKPDSFLFVVDGKQIKSTDVNRYLKAIEPDMTCKVFRTMKGTGVASELIDSCPLVPGETTQREAETWYKEVVGKGVGEVLNHRRGVGSGEGDITGATAISAYIAKPLSEKFFTDLGLRIPDFVRNIK